MPLLTMSPLSLSRWLAAAVGAATLICAAPQDQPQPDNTTACDALNEILKGDVLLPEWANYTERNVYWSNRQSELRPSCIVTPADTSAVAAVMRELVRRNASFTVRAGGHNAFAGASSISDGVTIDLVRLNQIDVAPDQKTVAVGPGNRWINVSRALDPRGLAVVGGRVSDVGVAGLVLGGGISYFSGMRGWACDNVARFEVVLSSGNVVNASETENSELFWALRGGGGSNFGIVTRFDLDVIEQGPLWANLLMFPGASSRPLLERFVRLVDTGLPADPKAHTYFVVGSSASLNQGPEGLTVLTSMFHATPPDNNTTPAVFQPMHTVPGATMNVTVVDNVSNMSLMFNEAYGFRKTWWDTSVAATSPALLQDIVASFETWLAGHPARGDAEFKPFLVFQPISMNILEGMQKRGGNALGLKPDDGPIMMVQLSVTWSRADLDDDVEKTTREFIRDVEDRARSYPVSAGSSSSPPQNLLRGFAYINYAGQSQDVLQRYGRENYERMQRVSEQYDEERHLQKLWRGYFKLES